LGPEAASLPVVLFPDGTKLLESAPADVAQKWVCAPRANQHDLAIIGGGWLALPQRFMALLKACIR
jgi:hypothetical protein